MPDRIKYRHFFPDDLLFVFCKWHKNNIYSGYVLKRLRSAADLATALFYPTFCTCFFFFFFRCPGPGAECDFFMVRTFRANVTPHSFKSYILCRFFVHGMWNANYNTYIRVNILLLWSKAYIFVKSCYTGTEFNVQMHSMKSAEQHRNWTRYIGLHFYIIRVNITFFDLLRERKLFMKTYAPPLLRVNF